MDPMGNGWKCSRKEDVDLEFIYDVGLDLSGQMSIQRALDVGSVGRVGGELDLPPQKKTSMAMENPHVQLEIHLQVVDFLVPY